MIETVAPIINTLNAPFWAAATEGRLVLPFCPATGRFFWPPSPISPFAGGRTVVWREAEPAGVLRSRVTYRRAFQKPFAAVMPYAVGLVELTAGPRLLAYIADPDSPDAPKSGDDVALYFAPILPAGPLVPLARRPAVNSMESFGKGA